MKKNYSFLIFLFYSVVGVFSQSGEIYQIGNENNYVAGDFYNKVQGYKARQQSQNWCWAACVQMVLKNQGLYVDQCDIVRQAFGQNSCTDKPADCYTIRNAAGGWNISGKRVRAWVNNSFSASQLIHDLAFKYPLIVGLDMPGQNIGHAYVLTAIFFRYNNRDEKIPYKVVLRDPWPSNQSRVELKWSDFHNRVNCVTHVSF